MELNITNTKTTVKIYIDYFQKKIKPEELYVSPFFRHFVIRRKVLIMSTRIVDKTTSKSPIKPLPSPFSYSALSVHFRSALRIYTLRSPYSYAALCVRIRRG